MRIQEAIWFRGGVIMGRLYKTLLVLFVIGISHSAWAGQTQFCAGFKEGYNSIKGNMIIVPICPIAPITPIGSTDFREGIKAGIRAASK
jgi:hypothetical protein